MIVYPANINNGGGGFDYSIMNFISYLRTGNIILDTIIAIIISSLIPFIVAHLKDFVNNTLSKGLYKWLTELFGVSAKYHTFNITMRLMPKASSVFVHEESSIDDVRGVVIPLFYKFKNLISDSDYDEMNVYFNNSMANKDKDENASDEIDLQSNCIYLPVSGDKYTKYNDKIDVNIDIGVITEGRDKITTISISIRSCAPDANKYIMQFIDNTVKEYNMTQINKYIRNDLFIYSTTGGHMRDSEYILFSAIKIAHSKNIENVYIPESAKIRTMLDHFRNKSGIYAKSSTIHKFGLLLHGPPGTGKTSMIKAIAKYLNRSIVHITLKDVLSDSALSKVFINNVYHIEYRDTKIPADNVIYAFEDIDTHIALNKRTLDKSTAADMLRSNKDCGDLDSTEIGNAADKFCNKQKNNNFTLGGFLNVLDGIVEPENRVVIMTTNCLEKLDPAIYRPGRVNMCIKLGYIEDAAQFRDICNYHHPADLPGNSESDMAALLASESLQKSLFDSAIVNKEYDQRLQRNKDKLFATEGIDIDNNEQINKIIQESLEKEFDGDSDSDTDDNGSGSDGGNSGDDDAVSTNSNTSRQDDIKKFKKSAKSAKTKKSSKTTLSDLVKQKKIEYLKKLTQLEHNKVIGLTASRLEQMCQESTNIADLHQKYFSDPTH